MKGMVRKTLFPLFLVLVCGCRRSPSFNVLGSYFPGWIVCGLVGILLAALTHAILYRLRIEQRIRLLPLVYVSLALLLASTLWLLIFD